ncbi:MAG: low specificity L-threonine aldolase [Pseudomonadota bacterium]
MQFASDNWAGVAPEISEALTKAGGQFAEAYGGSAVDQRVDALFSDVFERSVSMFFVATGTAANALAISAVSKPGGVVLCHEEAHINVDECGAIEHLTGGTRLRGLPGKLCKLAPEVVADELSGFDPAFVHGGRPVGISITQATEAGAVYSVAEVRALAEVAENLGLPLHMDGARFANALVATEASPAEMTWKAGVDILSFGATKNGCWCAEALVVFNDDLASDIRWTRKRAGHLFSKNRFVSVQFEAYLKDGLWLRLAAHANGMAARLADGLSDSNRAQIAARPQGNEVFVWLAPDDIRSLRARGGSFYEWPDAHYEDATEMRSAGLQLVRLVTSFATTADHVDQFVANVRS